MTGEPGTVPATTFRDHNTFPQQTPTNVPFAYPYYRLRKTDDMAVISLICALASFLVFPFIPAIAATILGFKSRDRIRKDPSGLEGEGLALAGIIIGSINIFLAVLVFILVIMLP